jgi:hypothetical protein
MVDRLGPARPRFLYTARPGRRYRRNIGFESTIIVRIIRRSLAVTSHNGGQGAAMGDKGGKKDKEKSKQQQVKKEKEEAQRKQDKTRPRTP